MDLVTFLVYAFWGSCVILFGYTIIAILFGLMKAIISFFCGEE